MKKSTEMGLNRTGIATSPIGSQETIEGAQQSTPSSVGDETEIGKVRIDYIQESGPVGSVPLPTAAEEASKTSVQTDNHPAVLIDKLGERLGFERTGVRLYEGVLAKFEALGSFDGGPTREELAHIHNEELKHFHLLRKVLTEIGADPTAVTPSADIAGVEAAGVLQVIADPRTTLDQSLHAALVAELADTAGWELLIQLARALGHDDMAADFVTALQNEEHHVALVRGWVSNHSLQSVADELKSAA
jgi:ferritin-like metal-binding protein YciE